MAIKQQPPTVLQEQGTMRCGGLAIGTAEFLVAAVAPTNGTAGDGAGFAGPGSIYIDTLGAKIYINTNTKASPTWTVVGSQS